VGHVRLQMPRWARRAGRPILKTERKLNKIQLGCMRLLGRKRFWVVEKKLKGFCNFCLNKFEFEIKV
jgi:hypothetical protein